MDLSVCIAFPGKCGAISRTLEGQRAWLGVAENSNQGGSSRGGLSFHYITTRLSSILP